ncbi:hypothetical protein AB0269_00700 [Microbacterium sp. NPDC077644]|uniref:hypothetical protein n=1 Tax=Microbacterium sp. NPDC077644 TaxID=3155055 RepID=UPI00344B424A
MSAERRWRQRITGTHDRGQRIHVSIAAWGRLVETSEIVSLISAAESGDLTESGGEYAAGPRRIAFAPMTGSDQT